MGDGSRWRGRRTRWAGSRVGMGSKFGAPGVKGTPTFRAEIPRKGRKEWREGGREGETLSYRICRAHKYKNSSLGQPRCCGHRAGGELCPAAPPRPVSPL